MARLDKLWRSVDGPGTPPRLDSRRVKARINAALDADQAERKIYMKQKLRTALIAAAAVAALTGTAFAAGTGWHDLSAWFQGDSAPVQAYVDDTVRSVSGKDYTLTVENSMSDERNIYMTVTVTALNDEAREFLHSGEFRGIDTWEVGFPGAGPIDGLGIADDDLEYADEASRRFALTLENIPDSVTSVRLWCGYMERDKVVEVPVVPVESLTVKLGASGEGTLSFTPAEALEDISLTVKEVTMSPLTCHIEAECFANDVYPNLRFRMADGTIVTQRHMMHIERGSRNGWTGQCSYDYQFHEVQALDGTGIVSVIAFDMEYPLDGSTPTPVEHDPALDPFTVTRMEPLSEGSGYTLPVRELTEKLGGACTWDAATGGVTCVYRDVTIVFHAGKDTALVNGETVELRYAPAMQNGVLAADWLVFENAWGIGGFVQRDYITNEDDPTDTTIDWHDWYIIP